MSNTETRKSQIEALRAQLALDVIDCLTSGDRSLARHARALSAAYFIRNAR